MLKNTNKSWTYSDSALVSPISQICIKKEKDKLAIASIDGRVISYSIKQTTYSDMSWQCTQDVLFRAHKSKDSSSSNDVLYFISGL